MQRFRHGRARNIDAEREGVDDQDHHHRVAPQAAQFLDSKAIDIGSFRGSVHGSPLLLA